MTAMDFETNDKATGQLHRGIDWKGAFWIASGVPALVLFSIGGIAANAGKLSFLVWALSIAMGFIQSFTYAEIAGLFPNKSGGASVYGATAWLPYSKFVAPLSVWCNWLAWTPVLSLGCSIAAAYILNAIAPLPTISSASPEVTTWLSANPERTAADAVAVFTAASAPAIRSWSVFSHQLGPVSFSFNATFFIGATLMLCTFAIQHRGILGTANIQKFMGLIVIVPMSIVGILPILTGQMHWDNFHDLVPLVAAGALEPGAWNIHGWTLILGAMFIAAWSAYAFETAVCYTSEFKNPTTDTFRAIFYSGLLCIVLYVLVPFAFQGVLGLEGMLAGPIADGSGVADALAGMVGGGAIVHGVMVMLMILALILCVMTAMAGSSRTLYQASVDGWLPRYLSHANEHGAPTRAMWTDLIFNLFILAIASADTTSFFFILAVSNVGYIIFNFLNLNSGWIHRIDNGDIKRPYRAPTWLIACGALFSYINVIFMGGGAKTWNPWALWAGVIAAALIIPVFCFRHFIQDGGRFPAHMLDDLGMSSADLTRKKAGVLPHLTLAAGVIVMLIANAVFPG
jgi:amino acid transporter